MLTVAIFGDGRSDGCSERDMKCVGENLPKFQQQQLFFLICFSLSCLNVSLVNFNTWEYISDLNCLPSGSYAYIQLPSGSYAYIKLCLHTFLITEKIGRMLWFWLLAQQYYKHITNINISQIMTLK